MIEYLSSFIRSISRENRERYLFEYSENYSFWLKFVHYIKLWFVLNIVQ